MGMIWGDPTTAPSLFETRVCLHLESITPSDWVVISGSNQSYTGRDALEIDVLLFTQKNCFVIEVKGGKIAKITDDKWLIGYHGHPPQENELFKKTMHSKNILHNKLKTRNYTLNKLPVVPVIYCYDDSLSSDKIKSDLKAIDKSNREMVVGFNQLLDKIKIDERASNFRSELPPKEIAKTVFTRYKFVVPEITFRNLAIFQKAHEFSGKHENEKYGDLVYEELGSYFQYICAKIAEETISRVYITHGDHIALHPYLIEKAKLFGRSFAFFPFVRYPEVDYVDYAQLAINLGYFNEALVNTFDIKGILSPPTYAITMKASVYKAHRQDRLTAQKNIEKHFEYFLSNLKKLGHQYGFLHHEFEDRKTITFWSASDIEQAIKNFVEMINEHSIAIGFEGFFELKEEWVENTDDLVAFVSDEFCKLYPIYKYLFEDLSI